MGLDDPESLLDEIQILHDAIANDVYVEYGVGYDPDYGTHRGFGDDSWIDEMDDLFAATTSYFRPSHFDELLREFYRRYRTLPDYESLCRQVDSQRGWPYEELVNRYQEQGSWEQALTWADDGLAKLPADSRYRPLLQEARGQALIYLDRPLVAGLLGYAYLLERDWQKAVEWASNPAVPAGWRKDDLTRTVATGLLRMGLAARDVPGDEVLVEELSDAPEIIREHGDRLEPVARSLPAESLLDGAVQLYEHLVRQAVGGRNRGSYAVAGAYCKVVQSIRRLQGRGADFERYYCGFGAGAGDRADPSDRSPGRAPLARNSPGCAGQSDAALGTAHAGGLRPATPAGPYPAGRCRPGPGVDAAIGRNRRAV